MNTIASKISHPVSFIGERESGDLVVRMRRIICGVSHRDVGVVVRKLQNAMLCPECHGHFQTSRAMGGSRVEMVKGVTARKNPE